VREEDLGKYEIIENLQIGTGANVSTDYPLITYYWTMPLILDHSYLVGELTNSKIADTKVSGFQRL
jgi:hypothetical protein